MSLFLCSFGYGGITSFTALYADANGVAPRGIYLTALALVILLMVVMLLVPASVAIGITFAGRGHLVAALTTGLLAGTALLGVEVFGLIAVLGRALEGTEPSDVST